MSQGPRTGRLAGFPWCPILLLLALGGPLGCGTAAETADRGPAPAHEPAGPTLKRLTASQYTASIRDLLGDAVLIPDDLEPDESVNGLLTVGSSVTSISPVGVEEYEAAAFELAEQALADPATRARLVPCEPAGVRDDDCATLALAAFGRRAWRRPLAADELARHVSLAGTVAETLGGFDEGLVYGFAGLLQSPWFLYRVELGEPDPETPGGRRYTDWEMASRLAYFFWNTTPDDELLAAAEAGELTTDAGLSAQVDRLLADDRAREGARNFFTEMLHLYELDDLNKDPTVFVHMNEQVGPSAREETLLGIDHVIFEEDGDWREVLTTRRAFLDRKLASIYAVPAPAREGFAEAWLPADGGRRGLLGQVSFLALQAHPAATSVTRRGVFVREVLLCQDLPPPPADANTSIPEATEAAPTMRDRVAQHLADPTCASCHQLTDPIGLGLEHFDGLGGWRETENGHAIDASGELDGEAFADAWGLAKAVHDHPSLGPCLSRTLYQYATAQVSGDGDDALVDWHAAGFVANGHRVRFLLEDLAMSPGFRKVGEVQ